MERGFNLSLDPGVGFIGYGATATGGGASSSAFVGVLNAYLPILFGIDFGGHELILGPRVLDQVFFGNTSSGSSSASGVGNVLYLGGSIGFAIRASSVFRILPEVAIGVPVWESADNAGSSSVFGGLAFQGGIAFLFGSSTQYEEPPPPPPPMRAPPPAAPPPPPPPSAAPPPPPPPPTQ
jgi:hypothetical protein